MTDVQLIHGDCLDVLPTLDVGSVDAIVTDPPFLTGNSGVRLSLPGVGKVHNATDTVGQPWGYSLDWVDAAARLRPAHWVVFAHFKMLGGLCSAIERHAEISAVFAWRKVNAPFMVRPIPRLDCEFIVWARRVGEPTGRMGEFRSLVIDVPMAQAGVMAVERLCEKGSGRAFHPCQKPLAVIQPFVDRLPAATYLDPFAGTGTTGVACLKAGRECILVEREARYIPVIRHRLADAATPLFAEARP
jgi:site-specific DNA-methyltransferase (adenine-specific)